MASIDDDDEKNNKREMDANGIKRKRCGDRRGDSEKRLHDKRESYRFQLLFANFDWRRSLSDQVKGIREGALARLWKRCQQSQLAGDKLSCFKASNSQPYQLLAVYKFVTIMYIRLKLMTSLHVNLRMSYKRNYIAESTERTCYSLYMYLN